MLRRIDNSFVKSYKYTTEDLKIDVETYVKSLNLLKSVMEIGNSGRSNDYVSMDAARAIIKGIVRDSLVRERSRKELSQRLGV